MTSTELNVFFKEMLEQYDLFETMFGEKLNMGTEKYRQVLENDAIAFAFYLAAADGAFAPAEAGYICEVLGLDGSEEEMATLTIALGLNSNQGRSAFESQPFKSFVLCLACDKLCAVLGLPHDYIGKYIGFFTEFGLGLVGADGTITDEESNDIQYIVNNMMTVASKEMEANEQVYALAMEYEQQKAAEAGEVSEETPAEAETEETPAEAEMTVEEPVVEEPIAEAPVVEEPIIEEPIPEPELAIEEPVVEEPIVEEPTIKEPIPEPELAIEEPIPEPELAIEEPVVEEPMVEEPVIEEPIAEPELAIEEPMLEEPAIEEPIIDEPTMEEPIPDMEMIPVEVLPSDIECESIPEDAIPSPAIEIIAGTEPACECSGSMSVEEIVANVNDTKKSFDFSSTLQISIGENGGSYIAMKLDASMINDKLGLSADGFVTTMLMGNCISVAIDNEIIRYNLFTGEKTIKETDSAVVAAMNNSILPVAEVNTACIDKCPCLCEHISKVLSVNENSCEINAALEKAGSPLSIANGSVVDKAGVVHSLEEVLWVLSL